MEKNFNDMTIEDLKKLQELLSIEINNREREEKAKAKKKIYELFDEVEKLCHDYNILLYDYDGEDFSMDMITVE